MGWELTLFSGKSVEDTEKITEALIKKYEGFANADVVGWSQVSEDDEEHLAELEKEEAVSPEVRTVFDKCRSNVSFHKPDYSAPDEIKILRQFVEQLAPTIALDDGGRPQTGEAFIAMLEEDAKNHQASTAPVIAGPQTRVLDPAFCTQASSPRELLSNPPVALEKPGLVTKSKLIPNGRQLLTPQLVITSNAKPVLAFTHMIWPKEIDPVEYATPDDPLRVDYVSFVHGDSYYMGIGMDWIRIRLVEFERMWKLLFSHVEFVPKIK